MKVMLVCERNNLLDAIIYIHNTAIQASSHEISLLTPQSCMHKRT